MKIIKTTTTLKEVLQTKPAGAFIYRIMYNDDIPFYVGISLKNLQARFKTHMAKFSGYKKYPDRPKCMEMVFEHTDLNFKCVGRQVYGYSKIRDIFDQHNIKYDMLNATVNLTQYSEQPLADHGTDLSKNTDWPLTNKFVLEQLESAIIEKELPLANDETIHLAEKRLGF